ncbi:MAG: hypothetical protein GF411_03150 [Candidatus Lokiarchaeota archaeon]|nr:hypothetical protein [Candidatus Lokiarchaeota archaeon]
MTFRRFTFRLALALGMTREQLMSTISSRELAEWFAFFEVEPFGYDYLNDLFANLAFWISSSMAKHKLKPEDFRLSYRQGGGDDTLVEDIKKVFGVK